MQDWALQNKQCHQLLCSNDVCFTVSSPTVRKTLCVIRIHLHSVNSFVNSLSRFCFKLDTLYVMHEYPALFMFLIAGITWQSFRELGVINRLLAVTPTLFNIRYVFKIICKKLPLDSSCQPTWYNLAASRWNVVEFFIRDFMQICWHIPPVVKIRQNNKYLHEDQCTFMIISCLLWSECKKYGRARGAGEQLMMKTQCIMLFNTPFSVENKKKVIVVLRVHWRMVHCVTIVVLS